MASDLDRDDDRINPPEGEGEWVVTAREIYHGRVERQARVATRAAADRLAADFDQDPTVDVSVEPAPIVAPPPLPGPARTWALSPHAEAAARPLGPGEEVLVRNDSGGRLWLRVAPGLGLDAATDPFEVARGLAELVAERDEARREARALALAAIFPAPHGGLTWQIGQDRGGHGGRSEEAVEDCVARVRRSAGLDAMPPVVADSPAPGDDRPLCGHDRVGDCLPELVAERDRLRADLDAALRWAARNASDLSLDEEEDGELGSAWSARDERGEWHGAHTPEAAIRKAAGLDAGGGGEKEGGR